MEQPTELPPLPKFAMLGPYKIVVHLVQDRTIARYLKCEVGAAAGFFDPQKGRIYIDRALTEKRKWAVYWHEITHALKDCEAIFNGGL
jgi:hypothetical protein